MIELGPYIIQSKELIWLKIRFDNQSSEVTPRIFCSNFNPSADCLPVLFQEKSINRSAFNAYDPLTKHFFSISFTKNAQVLRLRPASHDAFRYFPLSNNNKQKVPPTFLEMFVDNYWRYVKKPILKDQLERNFFDLRDKLRGILQSKIDSQYARTFPIEEWASARQDFNNPIPLADQDLIYIGFYKFILEIKKLTLSSEEYTDALTLVLTASKLEDIEQSSLPLEIKEEISILLRYFYDIKLHPFIDSTTNEKSYELSSVRFTQMQEVLFREDESLREIEAINYSKSLELRVIFCPPQAKELDSEEIALELFRCRASNLYLQALGIRINSNSNYIIDNFGEDYVKTRKYLKYCSDMLNNHEYLWISKDLFSTYLLHENDAYNPDTELSRTYNKLQNHINKLIIDEIKKNSEIENLLLLIETINELVLAISRVDKNHRLLAPENLLPYINNLNDLILVLKNIDNLEIQYELLRTCPLLYPENICQNITNIEHLKNLLAVISPANRKARTIIFNAYPIKQLVKLATSATNINYILSAFSSDCRNRLLKKETPYCSSLILNDDDLYLLLDKIHINYLHNLVYFIPLEIKTNLLIDIRSLGRILNLQDTRVICIILKLLPSMNRLQSLHNCTEIDKIILYRFTSSSGLQMLFTSISASEWYTLFPETNLLLNLISKLGKAKQKFVNCIPTHIKLRIYQETNLYRNLIQTPVKNKFKDFNDLKSLIDKLINPPSLYSYICFWKSEQKIFPNLNCIEELQILIIEAYLINPTTFNLNSAQKICAEYRTRELQVNQSEVSSNIKII